MEQKIKWINLVKAFQYLTVNNGNGVNKSSSGMVDITYNNDGMYNQADPTISIELHGYDMPNMSRHNYMGPFNSELEAYNSVKAKILEAIPLINEARADIEDEYVHKTPEQTKPISEEWFVNHFDI